MARRGILEAREIQLDGVGNRQRLFLSNIETRCRNRLEEKEERREEEKKNQECSFPYDKHWFVSPLEETSEFFAMTIFLRRKEDGGTTERELRGYSFYAFVWVEMIDERRLGIVIVAMGYGWSGIGASRASTIL